jgi:hypothetical protein
MSADADPEHTSAASGAEGAGSAAGRGHDSAGATTVSADRADSAHLAETPEAGAVPRSKPAAAAGLDFDDPLDRPSFDDTDRGWGDPSPSSTDDDFARFLSEKPPHHL